MKNKVKELLDNNNIEELTNILVDTVNNYDADGHTKVSAVASMFVCIVSQATNDKDAITALLSEVAYETTRHFDNRN